MDIESLSQETTEHSRKIGKAILGGLSGRGTLEVVRNRDGTVIEVTGTWRDDGQGDLTRLEGAAEQNDPLRYEGKLYDPLDKDRDHITTEVRITSYSSYELDAVPDEVGADLDPATKGRMRAFFNFKPVGAVVSD